MSFLGLINYCRQWIPDCSSYDKILRAAISPQDPQRHPLTWTDTMINAYHSLKSALCSAPALGLPDYSKPFHLYACEQQGTASGVLAQEHGGGIRPCAFLSKTLDTVAQGLPACLRAVAACAMMVSDAEKLVLSHPLILHSSHQVKQVLQNLQTQHMTAQRRSGYETILLSTDNLEIRTASSNTVGHALARLLNSQDDTLEDTDHDCLSEILHTTSIRPDLSSSPLETGEVIFVDGSCSKPSDNVFLCGYSVCSLPDIVHEAYALPFSSAQAAELYALMRACILFQGKDVTIYTDSRYAFGVAHDFGKIWQSRGFHAADGKPISHSTLVQNLIDSCHLPRSLAIVKTKAHASGNTPERMGNSLADHMAKFAAASGVMSPGLDSSSCNTSCLASSLIPDLDLISLQASASPNDSAFWQLQDAYVASDGLWYSQDGRLCLPSHCLPFLVREFHGVTHRARRGVKGDMNKLFCIANLNSLVDSIIERCLICAQNNHSKAVAKHECLPIPTSPFSEWQIDFTHMPPCGPFKYLLVIVDKFSKWVEAFPCSRENAKVVTRTLAKEIIPRYGVPDAIDSDKGTPFASKVTQDLCKYLSLNWRFHIPYHPQSSGIVERTNRTLKDKLTKAMQTTGSRNWVDLLPATLAEIRMTSKPSLGGYSPYEIIFGRPFPVPWRKGTPALGTSDLKTHMDEYSAALIDKLHEICNKVNSTISLPPSANTHPFQVGDKVLVQFFKRFGQLGKPRYSEPAEIVAITRTAVLTDLFPQWIHATRLKKAP
ncbi:protein NYNRIN-like [Neoarius graeffei]|uniref:protein NYNRIN-like n=1 Tax=Neoarius graeffei TaxID=443677 RepID=UPI00298CB370|nr:protein NYNRIN-like [Neoarius graeffei]